MSNLSNDLLEVMDYIRNHGSMTWKDYYRDFGHTRLSARIEEIRKHGIGIHTEMIREGRSRFGRYSFEVPVIQIPVGKQAQMAFAL